MGKRRRERDRPKSGPGESEYNPHKRILLSYGDEDEDEDETAIPDATEPAAGGRALLEDAQLTNYQLDEYPDEESEADVAEGASAEQDFPDGDGDDEKPEAAPGKTRRGDIKKDQRTNQFPALGLPSYSWDEEDGDDEDDDADSETQEAMAYLRAVRTEREGMPEIFSAANVDDAADVDEEWDPEEAYIGSPAANSTVEDATDPRVAFTKALIQKFLSHRTQLHQPASLEALQALRQDHPISFPRSNTKAYTDWHRILSSRPTQLAQLRSLQQETAMDLLALIRKHFLVKDKNMRIVTSSWLWSLLARLDDVGNMTNNEVYPLRELGKRAVYLQYCISNPAIAAQLEAIGEAGVSFVNEDENELDLDLESAKEPAEIEIAQEKPQQPQDPLDPNVTDNTRATLDMILVIVGEVFGQRDLLEFRQPWTVMNGTE